MKLNMLVVLATGLLLGADAPQDGQATKEVEKAIAALNDAFHAGDADKVKALMTEDHVAVASYYGGPLNRAGLLKTLPDHHLTEYSPGRLKVSLLGKDAALVTYLLAQKGTFKGREVPAKSYASAVWVRRGGRWLEAFYQETPLGGK